MTAKRARAVDPRLANQMDPFFVFFCTAMLSLLGLGQASFDAAVVQRVVESVDCIMAAPWHDVTVVVEAFASRNLEGAGGAATSSSLGFDDNLTLVRSLYFPLGFACRRGAFADAPFG